MNRNPLKTLIILYAAAFIAAFNENIINVALTGIISSLKITYITSQWLVTGYMIITAIVVAMSAFLFRRFSLRKLIFAGAAFLTTGSAGAFLSNSFALLLAFRLVQALGTGIFIPVMMTSVLMLAPKHKIGTYLAIGSCCITLGPAISPVVSGCMASLFGWRYVFVVPFFAVAIIAIVGFFAIENVAEPQKAHLDAISTILASVGLTALVFGFAQLTYETRMAIASLTIGALAIALFAWRQTKLSDPILDVSPFKKRGFLSACILSLVAMLTTFSMSMIMVLYFEGALKLSASMAGLLLLPPILVNSGAAIIAGRVMDAKGPWPLIPLGFFVIVVGQALVAIFAHNALLAEVVTSAASHMQASEWLWRHRKQPASPFCRASSMQAESR